LRTDRAFNELCLVAAHNEYAASTMTLITRVAAILVHPLPAGANAAGPQTACGGRPRVAKGDAKAASTASDRLLDYIEDSPDRQWRPPEAVRLTPRAGECKVAYHDISVPTRQGDRTMNSGILTPKQRHSATSTGATSAPWYNGWGHLLSIFVPGIAVVWYCVAHVHEPTAFELLFVDSGAGVLQLDEWWLHKNAMHRPIKGI